MSRRRLGYWALGALLLVSVALLAAWQAREALLGMAIERAVAASQGRLTIERPRGALLANPRIERLSWHEPNGLQVDLRDLRWRWRWSDLLAGRLVVSALSVAQLQLRPGPDGSPLQMPASLALPLPVVLSDARISRLLVMPVAGDTLVLNDLELKADYVPARGDVPGRYHVDRLALRSPWGPASARFNLADQAPFTLDADAAGRLDWQGLEWVLGASGVLGEVKWHARIRATPAAPPAAMPSPSGLPAVALSASGVLTPFQPRVLGPVAWSAQGVSPALLGLGALRQGLFEGSGELDWRSDAPDAGVSVRLALRNRQPAAFDQGGLPLASARATLVWRAGIWRIAGIQAQAGRSQPTDPGPGQKALPGDLSGDIEIDPAHPIVLPWFSLPRLRASLRLSQFDARLLDSRLPPGLLSGRLRLDDRSLGVDLVSGVREGPSLRAAGVLEGDRLVFSSIEAACASCLAGARLQAQGSVQIVAPWAVSVGGRFSGVGIGALQALAGRGLPGSLPDDLAGRSQGRALSGELAGHWQMAGALRDPGAGLRLEGNLVVDRGHIQGQTLRASASARLAQDRLEHLTATLDVGPNRLRADGAAGHPGDSIRYRLDAPAIAPLAALAGFVGKLGGAVTAEGQWRTAGDQPELSIDARASGLKGAGFGVLNASIVGRLDPRSVSMQVQSSGLSMAGFSLDRGLVQVEGSLSEHTVRVELQRHRQQLTARLTGALVGARPEGQAGVTRDEPVSAPTAAAKGEPPAWRWQGMLRELAVIGPLAGRLREPAVLAVGAHSVGFGPARFEGTIGTIGVSHLSWQPGRWAFSGEAALQRLASAAEALGLGSPALPPGMDPDAVQVVMRADLAGASAREASGAIALKVSPPPGFPGAMDADLRLREGRLDGRLALELPTLALANRWLGPAWSVDGRLQMAGRVSGTVAAPQLTGDVIGEALALEQRALGWRLGAGSLAARFEGDRLTVTRLRLYSGQQAIDAAIAQAAAAGAAVPNALPPGAVELTGTVTLADRGGQFRLRASSARIPLGPGQRLEVSGEAEVASRANRVELKGQLRADAGLIELRGGDAPVLPGDVEIVSAGDSRVPQGQGLGDTAGPAALPSLKLASDLRIDLGDRLRVRGSGVDARLSGTVNLRGTLPEAPRAFGTVRIRDGTYAAYGQQLEIERGQVVFNGPLDNPVLDIVALRRNLPVEAGVTLQGTVLAPRVRLTSRPEVADAEKLSWLVLGVPLEGAQSGAQSAALKAAVASLFGGSGDGLARTLGLDLLTVRSASTSDTLIAAPDVSGFMASSPVPGQVAGATASAATPSATQSVMAIGKRLNSRLLVTYEQGLRGVWNLLRIQYDITNRLSLRAQTGSESALDVLYRLSFD